MPKNKSTLKKRPKQPKKKENKRNYRNNRKKKNKRRERLKRLKNKKELNKRKRRQKKRSKKRSMKKLRKWLKTLKTNCMKKSLKKRKTFILTVLAGQKLDQPLALQGKVLFKKMKICLKQDLLPIRLMITNLSRWKVVQLWVQMRKKIKT